MRAWFEIYRAQFKTVFAVQLQYRAAMVIWLISTVLEPVVYLVVWSTVARARGGSVGGFTLGDFAAYYIALMVVNHLTFTWHMWEYDYRIRQGDLSPMLLRPLHPVHTDIAENLSYKALTLTVVVPATAGLVLAFRPALHPPLWALVALGPALLLAFAVRFTVGWIVALAAFWTTRINAINQVYFVAMLFFSGQLAPLALLPEPIRWAGTLLPFRWMAAFPVELLLGRLRPGEAVVGLAVQGVWVGVSLVVARAVWRAGIRRYTAVGA